MNDEFYTNSNSGSVDSLGSAGGSNTQFEYRTNILNASYNIEKGKILSTQLGYDNNLVGVTTEVNYNVIKKLIHTIKQIINKEKIFSNYKTIGIKATLFQEEGEHNVRGQ
ncbi:hypothetical protein [Campylobacter sp. JMF_03 NE3]|nr:hypothetical protein [Campylobacter sp. JMF_03 NE3]MDA3053203.1 hypothetical protein [Campylobacter sp. JMF_03 NE3]